MSTLPHLTRVEAVRLSAPTRAERGRARGRRLAGRITATARGYADLFAGLGIPAVDQREAAAASLEAVRSWHPPLSEELAGIAAGADLDLVDLGRVLARTEILTLAPEAISECSTIAHQRPGATVSVQTWDWYARFTGSWHLQRVDPLPGELAHAGLTECGMPGKIGLNAAGVAVHLNILRNDADDAGGVPVHAVLARVLAEATSLDEAVAMIDQAPTSSSSVITVTTADRVVMVEIAPGGTSVLGTEGGWLLHTNHFLALDRQDGARLTHAASTTHARMAAIEASTAGAAAPRGAADLIPLLCSPLEDRTVALLPDETRPEAERNATLATILMDPARRTIRLSPGVPQHADEMSVTYRVREEA
ncbi:C45 family autoproteolytic acyltransferase/hydolase [Ornithinimicrobium flavum]|uniref:C45 family autoproteolytic acyltransferase/hydolase n=1 Tax=Ornithinimicrobium flavum TaxID=1288636 RepID=UPI00106F17A0|nr:C45 family peptidase [Ornithinimicrobium flavum]